MSHRRNMKFLKLSPKVGNHLRVHSLQTSKIQTWKTVNANGFSFTMQMKTQCWQAPLARML